jgi:hypothetical protein
MSRDIVAVTGAETSSSRTAALPRTGAAVLRPDRVRPGSDYLAIVMIRSMPICVCSRPSCVSMKHASTYTPRFTESVCC